MTETEKKKKTLYENKDDPGFDPYALRENEHPTTDFETFLHLLKGSLGTGILAMPMGFSNIGQWTGVIASVLVGFFVTYCLHILIRSAHIISFRQKIPSLRYDDLVDQAFLNGPPGVQKYRKVVHFCVNFFLILYCNGVCCIYLVFVARNALQVWEYYGLGEYNVRVWIAVLAIPFIFVSLIRNLKFLVPFSLISNILLLVGTCCTLVYIFTDLPSLSTRPFVVSITRWPLFFGTYIFALECVGIIFSVENEVKNPPHFIGCPSVLSCSMSLVIILYIIVGFFGYLKYGDESMGSVTLNFPVHEPLAQSIKLMFAIAIYFSYPLNFHGGIVVWWGELKNNFKEEKHVTYELIFRVTMVLITTIVSVALPKLGPFISLLGAVALSFIGLIFPSIIEMVVYYYEPGYGPFKWILIRNIFLIIFGIFGFVFGTYVSILEFIKEFSD